MHHQSRRRRERRDEYTGPGGAEQDVEGKPSKMEYKVATWMRRNIPTKRTKFMNHIVEYFTSAKALDALMLSKFAKGSDPLFPNRDVAIDMLDNMLVHKLFHRGKKVTVTENELRGGKLAKTAGAAAKEASMKAQTKIADNGSKGEQDNAPEQEEAASGKGAEKKKRKIRLEMHPEQIFVDGSEAYVWIYDPIPMHYWLYGALLVVGAILLCLFPLWPASMRKGVYYLSIAAAGFLTFILGLVVFRFIVFCIAWTITGSKYHFWLFPNLTEDVGFFASFWPIYTYEYKAKSAVEAKLKSKKSKDKDSDAEDTEPVLQHNQRPSYEETETLAFTSSEQGTDSLLKEKGDEEDTLLQRKCSVDVSESESDTSNRSSITGKDFEMVDSNDV